MLKTSFSQVMTLAFLLVWLMLLALSIKDLGALSLSYFWALKFFALNLLASFLNASISHIFLLGITCMLNAKRLFKYPLPLVHLRWYWTSWCLFISSGSWQPSVSSVHLVGYCICCQYVISIYACPYIHSMGCWEASTMLSQWDSRSWNFFASHFPIILTAALLSGLILFFLGPTQSFSLPPSSYPWYLLTSSDIIGSFVVIKACKSLKKLKNLWNNINNYEHNYKRIAT